MYSDVAEGEFTIEANGRRFQFWIDYEKERRRYNLKSDKFDSGYTRKEGTEDEIGESIVGYLNREQKFRIVLRTPGVIYAASHFFEAKLPISGHRADMFDLLTIFKPVKSLGTMGEEKGKTVRPDGEGWERSSLFGLVDNLGRGTEMEGDMTDFDLLVCDDQTNEIADFIAASKDDQRIVMIHAKASDRPRLYSASTLQTVIGQVKKNLAYINPMSKLTAPNVGLWNKKWFDSKTEGMVTHRIRMGGDQPKQVWSRLSGIIRKPSATREIWVVLGQEFSLSKFDEERRKDNPRPEVIQMLFLILSMWQAVGEVGAKLRIFCSP